MVQPLFLEPAHYLEKNAVEMRLPPDPNKWPMEIVQELYKQVPYIADFEPHVEMDRADGEKGYGFGHIAISNQTEAPGGSSPEQLQAAGIRTVRVPIVIREGMLQPLDLLVTDDSKIIPLTEQRLRQAIFRPQAFDVTARTPGDQSMVGQLYPPYRQNYGMGGGGMAMSTGIGKQSSATSDLERYLETEALTEKNAAMIDDYLAGDRSHARTGKQSATMDFRVGNLGEFIAKHASVKEATRNLPSGHRVQSIYHPTTGEFTGMVAVIPPGKDIPHNDELFKANSHLLAPKSTTVKKKTASLLAAILPTIGVADYLGFTDALQEPGMHATFTKNAAATYPSIKLLLSHDPSVRSNEKIAGMFDSLVQPTVAQVRRLNDGAYAIKIASHLYWKPSDSIVGRADVIQRFGEKVALAADTDGAVTMGVDANTVTPEAEAGSKASSIVHAGLYKVQDTQGREHIGAVIPNLMDLDGKELPISLFTNGTVSAVQSDIVGTPAGTAVDLPKSKPSGHGFFFKVDGDRMYALIPMTFKASTTMPGQPTGLVGETFDGRPVEVSQQPNIQTVMQSPDGKLLIPQDWSWSSLSSTDEVDLISGEQDIDKEAQVAQYLESVAIRGSNSGVFTIDGLALDKVASEHKHSLDVDGAMFLLTALGVEPNCAIQKLGESMVGSGVVLVKVGRTIRDAGDEVAAARIKAAARQVPSLRQDLFKEAAELTDPTAVDAILSLGFINPENMGTFVSYLPEIDEAQGHMCELLLAARLGMTATPVGALEKAIKSTEQVIEGLKVLAFTS